MVFARVVVVLKSELSTALIGWNYVHNEYRLQDSTVRGGNT